MKKLIMHIRALAIGHNKVFTFLLITTILSGCGLFDWDKTGDYWYVVRINNDTELKISIVFGEEPITDTIKIEPKSFVDYKGLKVFEKQNVISEVLFEGGDKSFEERSRVYNGDQLLVDWKGPAEEKGKINHFYNYNSWESWLIDKSNDGIVQFTIYESDF